MHNIRVIWLPFRAFFVSEAHYKGEQRVAGTQTRPSTTGEFPDKKSFGPVLNMLHPRDRAPSIAVLRFCSLSCVCLPQSSSVRAMPIHRLCDNIAPRQRLAPRQGIDHEQRISPKTCVLQQLSDGGCVAWACTR